MHHSIKPVTTSELRYRAEKRIQQEQLNIPDIPTSPEEMLRLIHELHVHQVELEMQQEEMDHARIELEDSLGKYTELYDVAPAGYLTLDCASTILQANLTAAKLLGVDRSLLQGMRFKQFIVPADYQLIDTLLETVFTKKVPANCELRLLANAPQPSSKTLPTHSGRTIRLDAAISDSEYASRIIFSDITAQKAAEEDLCKSERNLRSITDQIEEVIVVADDKGVISNVSLVAETMFGLSRDEVVGHSFIDFFADDDIPAALKMLNDTLLYKRAKQVVEFKLKRKNGSLFDAAIHWQYYQDEEEIGFICLIWDITNRKTEECIRQEYEQKLVENQQFLQNIYNNVSYSVFVIDVLPDGSYHFKWHNAMNAKLTGIRNNEIIGKTPEEVFDPPIAEAVTSNYDTCLREGRTIQLEESLPLHGREMWWETVLNPISDENGNIHTIIGTVTNITERKLADDQLKKMSTAVEQSPAVVVITDAKGTIEYVNPMFTELTGYGAEEVKGKNPQILQSGLTPKPVYEELWKTILSGNIWRGEWQNKKKNGELFWESVVISAIQNPEGLITSFIAVKEDITEQKKMVHELIAEKEHAKESDRLKSAFLANISHEIRTPMNGILGFSALLKEPHLTGEEQAEYIDLIEQSGERMLNLINDLIDISRIEAGETKLQITPTPVNKVLRDLHAFFMPAINQKKLQFHSTFGLPDTESIIETDNGKLAQILTNLLQNALKFTRTGAIDFGYTRQGSTLEFYVTDTGIGIPDQMQEKIFDRFRQVDNTLTRNHEGSGLGLSITKAYVTILGGTITVKSREGTGSTFNFTLPYNPPGIILNPDQSSVILSAAKDPSPPSALCMLIVEDDVISRYLLRKMLKSENIIFLLAEYGRDAVELVQHHPEINLVLMDLKLPGMNGYEATKMIKKLRPDLPVIAQSAFTSIEDKHKAREAGCDGYVTKPINKTELLALINNILNHSKK